MIIYKSICLNIIINIKNKHMDKNNMIKDLIIFYVTENYKKYLIEHNLTRLDDNKISTVINELYIDRKPHLKGFLKESLKKIQGDEYMGDLAFQNILLEIFQDDNLNKKRLELEIKLYQDNL
jgi:hypothetical protein